ncbi:MAG: nitroreductase family protein [Hadesarchaea archaeon]|nr:nitroreductase family protein [Hadesarchaea archaeon]
MKVSEIIKERRSVRKFKTEPVDKDDLEEILEAARWAPSAGNAQPVEFVLIEDEDKKKELVKASLGQSFIQQAPVVIVVCANVPRTREKYGERGSEMYVYHDSAAAAQNIHLMAKSLGYATCWIGAFDDSAVKEVINAPEEIDPHVIIPVGKPKENPEPPERRSLDEIIHENEF